jgi:tetratricopeptide (TPR) repeat protein
MSETIEEMLQRWEEEPTPQLSLQLAEEYRQQGRLEEGTTILEQALRLHPNHVAARVAYGRFLLESGRMEDAAAVLEAVVEEDPTHLVANKLLIGLYLEGDRFKDARDRLDLYKLLNESDPEIEMLEAQLPSSGSTGAPPTAVDAAGRVFVLGGSLPPPDLHGLVAEGGSRVAVPARPRALASEGPFGDLWQGVDQEEYVRALGAEGIFPVVVVAEVEDVEEPAIELVSEPESTEEEPAEAPAEPESITEAVEDEPIQAIGATTTLANLYLDQGHLDDAAQAFEEVLAREPDNTTASQGLAETRRRMGESLEGEASADGEADDDRLDARGRKTRVLREYLDRLKAASGRLQ